MTDASLYTRCPKCETAFKVSQHLLEKAKGKVRCGACLVVFQATEHLLRVKQDSSSSDTSIASGQHSKSALERAIQNQPNQLGDALEKVLESDTADIDPEFSEKMRALSSKDEPKPMDEADLDALNQAVEQEMAALNQEPSDSPEDRQDLNQAASDPAAKQDASADETEEAVTEAFEENRLDADISERDIQDEDDSIAEDSVAEDGEEEFFAVSDVSVPDSDDSWAGEPEIESDAEDFSDDTFGANEDSEENEEIAASEAWPSTGSEEDFIAAETEADLDLTDDDWAESDETLEAELRAEELESEAGLLADNLSEQLVSEDTGPDPLDEFDELVERKKQTPRILMALALLLILLGLGFYKVWTNRQQLAWDESWGGTIKSICQLLPCELKPGRDVSLIKLRQREVSADENDEKKLDIKMLLTNDASFEQPYPVVVIKFSNSLGQQVALRRVEPVDYLSSDELKKMMPANSEVHIRFHTDLPHPDALGFEFQFQ